MDATKAEPRSRRAILAAAAGAAGAAAAASLLRAEPVRAGTDGDLILNQGNTGTAPTSLDGNLPMSTVFRVSNSATGEGTALDAVDGEGTAIAGHTLSGNGLYGDAMGEGTGVFANSGTGLGVDAAGFVGVYGFGDVSVFGDTTSAGTGVYGFAGDVQPPAPPVNVGVYARAAGAGTALQVQGKARFSRSGKFAVLAGRTNATKSVAGVTTGSLVLAVLQSNETGRWIRAAVAGSGKITVYFNTALATNATVGFIVFN